VVRLPGGAIEFDFFQSGHVASGEQAVSCSVDTGGRRGGIKSTRHETDQSSPSTEECVES